MTERARKLLDEVMALTTEERAELVDEIVALEQERGSLDDEAFAKAWRPELDRRWARFQRGEVESMDAREAIHAMRARLRSVI